MIARHSSTVIRSTTMTTPTDQLVRMVLDNTTDRDAEGMLFARHQGFMRGIASVSNLPIHEWDDCIHSSWERAMRSLPRLRDHRSFKSWLATITRNEAISMHRKRNREQPSPAVDLDEVFEEDLDRDLVHGDRRRALSAALATLDSTDRQLIDLLFIQRQPYKAVAHTIGCQVGSVGPTRGRVLDRLRAAYLRETGEDVDVALPLAMVA